MDDFFAPTWDYSTAFFNGWTGHGWRNREIVGIDWARRRPSRGWRRHVRRMKAAAR